MGRKWVYKPGHPKANERGFVAWEDYGGSQESVALYAPIMMDRFYENTAATDGTDIGSRRKHREYMRANNLTTADDYKGQWAKAQKERAELAEGRLRDRTRRDDVARAIYNLHKP